MSEAEEHHIHLIERHVGGEGECGLPHQTFMHLIDAVAGVALTVGKHQLHLRMIDEQADEFTSRISGCS